MLNAAIRGVAHPASAARDDMSGDDEPKRAREPSSTRGEPEPDEKDEEKDEEEDEEDEKTPAVRKRLKRGPCRFIEHMCEVDRRRGPGAGDDESDDSRDSEDDEASGVEGSNQEEMEEEDEDGWAETDQATMERVEEGDEQDDAERHGNADDDDDDLLLVHAIATQHERRHASDGEEGEEKDDETAGDDKDGLDARTPGEYDNEDDSELELAVGNRRSGDQTDGPGNDGTSQTAEASVPVSTRSSTGRRKPVLTTTQKAALEAVQRLGLRISPNLKTSIEKYICTGAKELLGHINNGVEATDRRPAVSRRVCQKNILQVIVFSAVETLLRRARRKVTNTLSGHGASRYPHSVFFSPRAHRPAHRAPQTHPAHAHAHRTPHAATRTMRTTHSTPRTTHAPPRTSTLQMRPGKHTTREP